MTHTAATPTSASTPNAHAQNGSAKVGQGHAAARAGDGQGKPSDLFASLLALVAEAPALQSEAQNLTPAEGVAPTQKEDTASLDADDPLSALLAWMQPGLMPAGPKASAPEGKAQAVPDTQNRVGSRADTAPTPATELPALTAETRRIDGAPERQGAIALPAAVPAQARAAAPAWLAGAARSHTSTNTSTDKGTTGGSDIAMRWQRGMSTEHASATGLSARSTVELGERRAPQGAPSWSAAIREASHEGDEMLTSPGTPQPARMATEAVAGNVSAGGTSVDVGGGDASTAEGGHGDTGSHEPASDPLRHSDGQDEAVEVRHWGSGELRNASLRVGENGEQSIDIQLSLRGDEVQLAFRTDDENARELLRQQANETLGQLLQDSGMSLRGLSVGAHGQAPADSGSEPRHHVAQAGHAAAEEASDNTPGSPAPRNEGGTGLDLFI